MKLSEITDSNTGILSDKLKAIDLYRAIPYDKAEMLDSRFRYS